MNNMMSGGEAVVATLKANGVDTIFGIPGVHTLPIYDAIQNLGLRHVLARHEQGAGFMAEGYARATGRMGVASVISGPGLTNIATPVASAFADSIPLLVIASAPAQSKDSRLRGSLHELKNQFGVMEALAGFSIEVTTVEQIPDAINAAVDYLVNERPRGAYVQIPKTLLKAESSFVISAATTRPRPEPAREAVMRAAAMLKAAERPVIIAGAGVTASGANAELIAIAEQLNAPVILGAKSHDAIPGTHPLAIPTTYVLPDAVVQLAAESDIALVIGSKLGAERTDYGTLQLPANTIQIDIDNTEIGRDYPVEIGIRADARACLQALLTELGDYVRSSVDADRRAITKEDRVAHATAEFGTTVEYITALDEALSDDVIVSADMTRLGYASSEILTSSCPRTYLHSAELCAIGCGLPTALGAKAAFPNKSVLAICGDGGFLLNPGELATSTQEHLPIVVIVFNDHAYGAVKTEQISQYKTAFATDLVSPDYVALAKSFGADGVLVNTPEGLQLAVKEAFASPERTTLIEVAL